MSRSRLGPLPAAAVLLGLAWAGGPRHAAVAQPVRTAAPAAVSSATGQTRPVPLVNADDELIGFLEKAERCVKEKKYDQAIRILQALIMRPRSSFVPSPDGRRFVSLRVKANEVIGRMGPVCLKRYRALYDPQAQQFYEEASSACDTGKMRWLADRYLHTTHGPKALAALGAIHFDRGRFAQAARSWQRLLRVRRGGDAEALLLAKVAVAHHLAGEAGEAAKAARELAKRYPEAAASLGGRRQNLVKFVSRTRTVPPRARVARQEVVGRWLGLGGLGGRIGVMDECDVVLAARWSRPESIPLGGRELMDRLVALGRRLQRSQASASRYGARYAFALQRSDGHIRFRGSSSGTTRQFALPPTVHPVVVGDLVICRWDDAVVAHDLVTGQEAWKTLPELAVTRKLTGAGTTVIPRMYPGTGVTIGDRGHYTLTVGGGNIFTVCEFRPEVGSSYEVNRLLQRNPALGEQLADTSSLAAISIDAEGLLLWRVGNGEGEDPLNVCKFLSAPTYDAGRLYVVATYMEHFYLMCLDAEDKGSLKWHSVISQVPVLPARYARYSNFMEHYGSCPAVVDGVAFAVTNAGVVAAFDAENGEATWAYQYSSNIPTAFGVSMSYSYRAHRLNSPANPVIVAKGRVICLPADSEYVLGLGADDGRLLWRKSRGGLGDLSAIDEDRVLLSGGSGSGGLVVLGAADGKELFRATEARDIVGRPAVTRTAVLASGRGKVYRLDLSSYSLSMAALMVPDGLLGNLVSVDGKLVAANAAGLCAYFSYAEARDRLTSRLAGAEAKEHAGLLLQRAQMAFNARRFDDSLTDLDGARKLLDRYENSLWSSQLPARLYRTYVALGNHAKGPGEMPALFEKALSWARSDQEKAHMKLRLAKCREQAGELAAALALAHEIGERYPQEEIVDVRVGPGADDTIRFGRERAKVAGKVLAQSFIKRMLRDYPKGRQAYAEFDARAKAALAKARAAKDPAAMAEVYARWPNSLWADRALYAAAEECYLQAAAAKGPQAEELFRKARQHLFTIAGMPESPLKLSANVALAVIWARGGKGVLTRLSCDDVEDANPDMDTVVSFADIRGTLREIIPSLRGGKLSSMKVSFASVIDTPLKEIFSIGDKTPVVLRDQEYRPVRLGQRILVLAEGRAVMLDTAAGSGEELKDWRAMLTSVDTAELAKRSHYPPGMRLLAGLSKERKVAVVADRKSMVFLDVGTAKIIEQKSMDDLGLGSLGCMGLGGGLFVAADTSGRVVCLDIATGKVRWRANLPGTTRHPFGPPQIDAGVVLMRSSSGRTMTCFDAAGGKVLGKWETQTYLEGRVTKEGLLVALVGGELSFHEISPDGPDNKRLNRLAWKKQYDASAWPTILAVSGHKVAVSPGKTSGEVQVVSALSTQKVASLRLAGIGTAAAIPVDARFDRRCLYVVGSTALVGRRGNLYGQLTRCRGLNVQRFDLGEGERLWSRDIDPDARLEYEVLPLTVGQKHVAFTVRDRNTTGPCHAYVLDSAAGKVRAKIELSGGAGAAAKGTAERRRILGPPVMTNGRLCVETLRGVTVYGGQ